MQKRVVKRKRPNWDESFMFSALWAATRSSCLYFQTGAVIVNKDNRIIATGYNGAGPRIRNCLEVGCRKDREGIAFEKKGEGACRGLHAEVNAMNLVARKDLIGTTIYSLHLPCSRCAKVIESNGIAQVVYSLIYEEPKSLTREIFAEAGIKLRKLDLDLPVYFAMMDRTYRQKRR
jgi:dCMP deaminase